MLYHTVLMNFREDVPEEDIQKLEAQLDDLPNRIMEIQMFEFGRDVVRSERSADFALVALFANPAALARYQEHPAHREVLAYIGEICTSVQAGDFEIGYQGVDKEEQPEPGLWE
jgi:hypothetical protein